MGTELRSPTILQWTGPIRQTRQALGVNIRCHFDFEEKPEGGRWREIEAKLKEEGRRKYLLRLLSNAEQYKKMSDIWATRKRRSLRDGSRTGKRDRDLVK